jgi:3-isopropylmalate/(R)-2-methylmalate dehydratase large subunit
LGTIAEKILARAAGVDRVEPGVIVDAFPDLVMSHTATWRSVDVMRQLGADRLYDPSRIAIVLDHVARAKTEKSADDQRTSRQFARDYGIEKFYDVDAGIAHLVLMEEGHVGPGDLVVGTDSHCTIYWSPGGARMRHRLHGGHFGLADGKALDEGSGDGATSSTSIPRR